MKDLDIDQALRDIVALIDHAREPHPHFESPRGVTDIARAEQAIATIKEFLAFQESLEQFVHCGKCGVDMVETESGSLGDVGAWAKYECPACKATVEIALEPND